MPSGIPGYQPCLIINQVFLHSTQTCFTRVGSSQAFHAQRLLGCSSNYKRAIMGCSFISPVGFPLTDSSTVISIAERNPHCRRPCIGTPARTHVCKILAFWRGHGDGKDSVNLMWTRVSSHDHDTRHPTFDDLPCMAYAIFWYTRHTRH